MTRKLTRQLAIIFGLTMLSWTTHSQDISLMCFNIGSANWIANRDSVVARILFNDPDVFCAIEATGSTRPFIETSLTDYHMLQTFSNPNLSESHIFFRKNMFTVVDSGFAEMQTYGGYTGPARFVNWAMLEETSSQNQFLVYASHFLFVFPANPDSGTIGQYRHADGMVQLMNQHASLNIPMITAGDFNADSSTAVMQFLLHQTPVTFNSITINNPVVLDDSWYIANPAVRKPGTVGMSGLYSVDWILTSPNTNVQSALIDDQGVAPGGGFPSDHRPLMITFRLSNATSIIETSNDTGPLVFPNPFQDHVQFRVELDKPERISVQIFDVIGNVIIDKQLKEYNSGIHRIKIDLSGLADYIHFYKIETVDQITTGSILKMVER